MSSVVQTQGIVQTTASFPNATLTAVDLGRPQTTPAEAAYAEGTDHVTRAVATREMEAGHVVIDFPSTLNLSTVFLRKLSIKQLLPTAQKGLQDPSSAFFPSGAPTDATIVRTLVDTGTTNSLAMNADSVRDLFGNLRANATVRSFPGITLREGEFVHVELFNNSGGDLNSQVINAVYKLGLNAANTGKP